MIKELKLKGSLIIGGIEASTYNTSSNKAQCFVVLTELLYTQELTVGFNSSYETKPLNNHYKNLWMSVIQ